MPAESRGTPRDIRNYLGRTSGPLPDRIDLHIAVPAVKFQDITSARPSESSAQIRERVIAARKRQQERFKDKPRITCNARMGSRELKQHCTRDEPTMELLKFAMADLNFSARAYDRILKVARTIAALAGAETLTGDRSSTQTHAAPANARPPVRPPGRSPVQRPRRREPLCPNDTT